MTDQQSRLPSKEARCASCDSRNVGRGGTCHDCGGRSIVRQDDLPERQACCGLPIGQHTPLCHQERARWLEVARAHAAEYERADAIAEMAAVENVVNAITGEGA